MFTKTEVRIMEVFVSKIDKKFSIQEISKILKRTYPLIHRSIHNLLRKRYILRDEKELLSLNYKENLGELGYIEVLRSRTVLSKDKTLSLFVNDVSEKIKTDFFILLVFGSYLEKEKPRDIDVLCIIEDEKHVSEIERTFNNISSHFTKNFEVQVISTKSAYEMIGKRDKVNILNETLSKHILLFGAENYYRILKNAR